MPAEGELSGNKLTVSGGGGTPRGGPPRAVDGGGSGGFAGRRAARPATDRRQTLPRRPNWTVTWESGGAAAVVERAWVQSWLSSSARQDRAVFAFTSSRKELELTIPAGAAADQISVLLDGKAVAAQPPATAA